LDSEDRRFEKGFFSSGRFPVAEKYIGPPGRGRLFVVGAIAALILAVVFLADAFVGRASTVTAGALSRSHALFASECSTCHVPLQSVPDANCTACHEKFGGGVGAYSFASHYLYRSGDFDRSAPAARELTCAGCHQEHQGREASLQRVADAYCTSCHEIGSFRRNHPEFRFAAESEPDPANLKFPHVKHVREVMEEYEVVDAEAACLRCHQPEATGRSFQPISFAQHCDACHLTSSAATPYLPVRGGGTPGVATLSDIRRVGGPASLWADYWNPNEFRERGGEVQKRPVYHADPWVLENLRRLRRELYPGAELADLLRTSPEVAGRDARLLPQEAIATLRAQIQALRGDPSPDVQRELASLSELLDQAESRVDRPFAPVDETRFGVRLADRSPALESGTPEEAAYLAVVDSLTATCQMCHIVERATIRRVKADQRTLVRAEFDHRAHVIHARCLDCHSAIPIRDALATGEDPPAELDRAEIQNLPTIETCRSCHSGRSGPADSCTSCHLFHPDKSHWGTLTRYQQRSP
jgi:predicted CXXCH cytochrome family protein